ncbi:unnamed protein product [Cylindrotheca closterium]|nr:unnamed protein product [Cylindrotheca closterium]
MQETEDKISAELLELSDLMRSGSKDDRTNKRDTMPPGGSWLGGRRPRVEVRVLRGEQKRHTTELDKAIMKQLEAFQISGKAKQDCKNKKHQTDEETTTMEERVEDTLQHISGSSQDEIHIFQSNSQIDSFDASLHEKCNIHATNQRSSPMMKEESVEVAAIFHGDLQVEIDDESEKILSSSERGLKETYPLEFSGRAPSSSRCAKSLLCRDPSISSSSSDESSLLWLDEKLDI